MTVFKNDAKPGLIVPQGLCGPFCWAALVAAPVDPVRIESAPAPSVLADEEDLEAAREWERTHPHGPTDSEPESDDDE